MTSTTPLTRAQQLLDMKTCFPNLTAEEIAKSAWLLGGLIDEGDMISQFWHDRAERIRKGLDLPDTQTYAEMIAAQEGDEYDY